MTRRWFGLLVMEKSSEPELAELQEEGWSAVGRCLSLIIVQLQYEGRLAGAPEIY